MLITNTIKYKNTHYPRGFTLIELMLVCILIVIATAMVMPAMNSNDVNFLQAGVNIMISDLDYAQATSINEPSEMVYVCFDPAASRWWVAPESTPDIPYTHQYTNDPYDSTMGVGVAAPAQGVTFSVTNMAGNRIKYDAFGRLTQILDPLIILTCGEYQATITIDTETGFLTAVN